LASEPRIYAIIDERPSESPGFRSDEFYGQPLSTVVRTILEKRRAANLGAASVAEIYDAMEQGGFSFGSSNSENAKRNLRISLTKNSAIFHRLPNNRYGLLEWYPNVREAKSRAGSGGAGPELPLQDQPVVEASESDAMPLLPAKPR
jgi:hypothetical protein